MLLYFLDFPCKWYHTLFVSVRLISLSRIPCKSIHVVVNGKILLVFKMAECLIGLPWWLSSEESACNAGDSGSIPGSGRSSGEGNGYPFQYSYLENFMYRGSLWTAVHGVTKSWTWLSDNTFTSLSCSTKSDKVIEVYLKWGAKPKAWTSDWRRQVEHTHSDLFPLETSLN